MIGRSDLRGLMSMMPAFTTPDGGELHVTDTINVQGIHDGVNKIIADGASVVTTTGSFGEATNLLPNEFETLVRETAKAVNKRVPMVVGVINPNTRATMAQVKIAADAGADAVMCAVPYYYESSIENAIQFYDDIAQSFPQLGMMIYHNPIIHKVRLPVSAVAEIAKNKNFIGMKDSHRTPEEFDEMMSLVGDKISVFVLPTQYVDYAEKGAAGVWAIDSWMGPEPYLKLLELVRDGKKEEARQLAHDIFDVHTEYCNDLKWRETGHKLAIKAAGYVDPGPLRRPFVHVPEHHQKELKTRGEYWRTLRQRCGAKI